MANTDGMMDFEVPQKPKAPQTLEVLSLAIPLEDYSNLLMWQMENCAKLGLSLNTKYHAKRYFERILTVSVELTPERYTPLLVACLAEAIKIFENREVSDKLAMKILLAEIGVHLTSIECLELEIYILKKLVFQMRESTPEDYFQPFFADFPFYSGLFKKALPSLIDLVLIHPRACNFTAQEIFFGAVKAVLQMIGTHLTDRQKSHLNGLTDCWKKAKQVHELIRLQIAKEDEHEDDI